MALGLFALMSSLVIGLVSHQQDRGDVQDIKNSLATYYSRLEAVKIAFSQQSIKIASATIAELSPEEAVKLRIPLSAVAEYNMLAQFPRCVWEESSEIRRGDGSIKKSNIKRFLSEDALTMLGTKSVAIRSDSYSKRWPRSPLNAIGAHIEFAESLNLVDLMNGDETVSIKPHEKVRDWETIVLQIGPNFPPGVKPPQWKDVPFYIQVWLAVEHNYLPVRFRLYDDSGLRLAYEIRELVTTEDHLRSQAVVFPSQVQFLFGESEELWDVKSVEINPKVSAMDFSPKIPNGYEVMKDGTIASRYLAGGEAGRKVRISDSTVKAKQLLHSPEILYPSNEEGSFRRRLIVLALTVMGLVTCVVVWRAKAWQR